MEREMEMEMEIQDHLAVHAIGEDSSDAMVDEQEKKRPKTRLGCLTCKYISYALRLFIAR
jgi:hypothetical protein